MKNLVIGNTSQISYYFPKENFEFISSRNVDYKLLNKEYNRVFLCFGESRKFIDNNKIYDEVNYDLTIDLINKLKNKSQKIVVYSTCELWNKYSGQISLNSDFNFFETNYLNSKFKLTNHIISNKNEFENVIIMFPFNFNSIHRNVNFLFGKIFNSIIEKKKIEIGNTYFYRDIIHPKFVVENSIQANENQIIGSGRMIFVNDFIRDLYKHYGLDYSEFIYENFDKFNEYEKNNEYYLKSENCLLSYKELLDLTIEDINTRL